MIKTKLALASVAVLAAGLTACGDDSSPTETPETTDLDAGDEAETDDTTEATEATDPDETDDQTETETEESEEEIPDSHAIPTDAGAGAIMCAELGSLCHGHDMGDGELGDRCHDIGHAGDEAACAEVYDECIAFCQEHDAGHEHEAETVDAGHEGGHEHGEADPQCEELGHLCHDLDDGEGLAHECHEVGHAGESEACAEIYDECIALCGADAGAHDHGDASTTLQPFELRFAAMANDEVVDCATPLTVQTPDGTTNDAGAPDVGDAGAAFPGVGSSVTVSIADLRFYVSDLRFYDSDGMPLEVELDENDFQYSSEAGSVALVDLTGTDEGSCGEGAIAYAEGTARTNSGVTGSTELSKVASVSFAVGVPQALMQEVIANNDAEGAPSPLGEMYWSWASGYRHFVLNAALETASGFSGEGYLHIGSRACGPADGLALEDRDACDLLNTPVVALPEFDPSNDTVVVDLAAVVGGLDFVSDVVDPETMEVIGQQPGMACHSSPAQADCPALFEQFGINIDSGESDAEDNLVFYRQ